MHRSRWAIILAGMGVFSFIIPLQENNLLSEQQEVENSINFDALQITYWDRIEERAYVDTFYPRAVLDSAEDDIRDYNRWMENNVKGLFKTMSEKKAIMLDSLGFPVPKTEIGAADLSFYRDSFIGAINSYNQHLEDYNNIQDKRESLKDFSSFLTF